MSEDQPTAKSNWFGWAAYLACSWTWCIGMFLPVLLVRDYGFWGWLVFAVPNVIGAAAMGWVIASPESSRRIVERHLTACIAFSVVTIAFHFYFVLLILESALPNQAVLLVLIAAVLMSMLATNRETICAIVVLAGSLLAFAICLLIWPHFPVALYGSQPLKNLAMLGPVCVFGFVLNPYLDLTFHHARQESNRAAFAVGFGVLFLAMIIFSLYYAAAGIAFTMIVGLHMALQTAFTIWAHADRLRSSMNSLILPAMLCLIVTLIARLIFPRGGLSIAEGGYRMFMGFYGLVFPAYVWLCMYGRRQWIIFALAVLIAAPMFWMGFIENKMIWLLPGLAVVLVARTIPLRQANSAPI